MDPSNKNLSRRCDELYKLPYKFQNPRNTPPETRDTPNMNCSKQISKTFRLCHHLTSGSLPYWNNSELTGFNQFLIIPCIHPKSLDSHSLFASKMCGIKEGKKKKKKRQRGDCFLHQLFWRIRLRAANLLSQVKVFLKIPGDN